MLIFIEIAIAIEKEPTQQSYLREEGGERDKKWGGKGERNKPKTKNQISNIR